MRQDGAIGGVKAPAPLILPDPAKRFAHTAARLEALADGHPMADWLRFMAQLTRAQDAAATRVGPVAGPPRAAIEQAADAGLPPLAANEHRRAPAWREGLACLIDRLEAAPCPAEARSAFVRLRDTGSHRVEALADSFLRGSMKAADVGQALYIAAALQVYFTQMAADLPATALHLLRPRGLCPCCGSPPVSGMITASGDSPGVRYLHCSLCSTAWNHVRATCITCGGARAVFLEAIGGDEGVAKAEICRDCRTYAKLLYQARDTDVDPFADDLSTLGLDLLVSEAGWARHAPNPLILVA